MQKLLFVFLSLLVLNSCGTSAQISSQGKAHYCSFTFGKKYLEWKKVRNAKEIELSPFVGSSRLPLEYEIYELNAADLASFLKGAQEKNDQAEIICFPLLLGCYSFVLTPSDNLSSELASKFPEIISLNGISNEDKELTCRIDYYAGNLKVEFNHKGEIYLLDTWKGKSRSYYLTFKKEKGGYSKSANER